MATPTSKLMRRADLLKKVLTAVTSIFIVYILIIFTLMPGITPAKIAGLVALVFLVALTTASYHNRFYYLSAYGLVFIILVGGFVATLTNGGLQGYVTPLMLTAPIATAVFLPKRVILAVVAVMILLFAAQIWLENAGRVSMTPYPEKTTQIASFVMLVTTTCVCAAAVGFFAYQSDEMINSLVASEERLRHARDSAEMQSALAQKRKEEAESAALAERNFFSTMNHELRTPINGIMGMAQILAKTELTPAQRENVRIVYSCGESLLYLVNDLLDLAKLESGRFSLKEQPVNFEELANSVKDVVKADLLRKKLDLLIEIRVNDKKTHLGDQSVYKQILLNMVSNAVKFTDDGNITLSIDDAKKDHLTFSVVDSGPGVLPENQLVIFSRFRQSNEHEVREEGGTGLGLAICKKFVDLMGGEIGVFNNEGRGATFWFTVPAKAGTKLGID